MIITAGAPRRLRLALTAALAIVATVGFAPGAHAASTTPGDFSSYLANNPSVRYVDNCTVELGPVVDSIAFPSYRKIGGVRVNCGSVHSVIKATVWEQYYYNGQAYNYGSSTVGTRYYQSGSGYGLAGILRSPAICAGVGSRGLYWRTAALVQTENVGGYRYSDWQQDNAGC